MQDPSRIPMEDSPRDPTHETQSGTEPIGVEPSLAQMIGFIERYWLSMLLPALALALLAFILLSYVLPPSYRASATLLVAPPSVSSSLQQGTLSVHAYQRLLESDAVLIETMRRLAEEGVLEEEENLLLGRDIDSKIFVSRRQETTSLAPMIEASGTAGDPDKAARIVNTWVAVFLETTRAALQEATTADVDLVETQYPQTREELEVRENEWDEVANQYQQRITSTATGNDRRIAAYKRKTLDLISEFITESRVMLEGLLSDGLRELAPALSSADPETSQFVVERLHQLASVRAQMAGTLSIVELEKAITDDALWHSQVIQEADNTDLSAVARRSLVSQEVNPIYVDLAVRAMELEVELQKFTSLAPDSLPKLLRDLERVERERSAGLAKLQADRTLEVAVLRREQRRELEALERERSTRMTQLRRPIDLLASLERDLRRNYSQAVLAKAQVNIEGLRLAAPAVPSPYEEEQQILAKTAIAFILGALLGALVAFARAIRRPAAELAS